jgi:hypothetical protein
VVRTGHRGEWAAFERGCAAARPRGEQATLSQIHAVPPAGGRWHYEIFHIPSARGLSSTRMAVGYKSLLVIYIFFSYLLLLSLLLGFTGRLTRQITVFSAI